MERFRKIARRALITFYLIILHAAVLWLLAEKFLLPRLMGPSISQDTVREPVSGPQVGPAVIPADSTTPETPLSPAAEVSQPPTLPVSPGSLIIPVQGVSPSKLQDTYTDSRSEGRSHDAIDIMAAAGTPVLAAADGEIVKFYDSKAGGITIYQISSDRKYFFYYAHLQSRAENITEKQFVPRGTTIGFVGDSGNAGAGNFHLHFAISLVRDPARFWDSVPINPYPVLKGEPLPQP